MPTPIGVLVQRFLAHLPAVQLTLPINEEDPMPTIITTGWEVLDEDGLLVAGPFDTRAEAIEAYELAQEYDSDRGYEIVELVDVLEPSETEVRSIRHHGED